MTLEKNLSSEKMEKLSQAIDKSFFNLAMAGPAAWGIYFASAHAAAGSFLRSYGIDFSLASFGYTFLSAIGLSNSRISKYFSAGMIFGVASFLEIDQKYHPSAGIFDAKDFVAYASGIGFALGVDYLAGKISGRKNE